MKKSTGLALRALLRENEDGMTVAQMSRLTDTVQNSVLRSLKAMPDAYIDRWQTAGRRKYYSAVWCVVVPPENCPKPNEKE